MSFLELYIHSIRVNVFFNTEEIPRIHCPLQNGLGYPSSTLAKYRWPAMPRVQLCEK